MVLLPEITPSQKARNFRIPEAMRGITDFEKKRVLGTLSGEHVENKLHPTLEERLKNRLPHAISAKNIDISGIRPGESFGVHMGESLLCTFQMERAENSPVDNQWIETLKNKERIDDSSYFIDLAQPDTILSTKYNWNSSHDTHTCIFFSLNSVIDTQKMWKQGSRAIINKLKQVVHGALLTALMTQCSPDTGGTYENYDWADRAYGVAQNEQVYTVHRWDTLMSIAKRYWVSVSDIKARNGIMDDTILAGHDLIIPSSYQEASYWRDVWSPVEHNRVYSPDLEWLFQSNIPAQTLRILLEYVLRNPNDQWSTEPFNPGDSETLRAIGKNMWVIPLAEEAMSIDYRGHATDITHALLVSIQSYLADSGIKMPLYWEKSIGKTKSITSTYLSLKGKKKLPQGINVYQWWKKNIIPEKLRYILDNKPENIYVFTFLKGKKEHSCLVFRTDTGYQVFDPSYGAKECLYEFDSYIDFHNEQKSYLATTIGLQTKWIQANNIPTDEWYEDTPVTTASRTKNHVGWILERAIQNPTGKLRGKQYGNIAPDEDRLALIASKMGIGSEDAESVRYANLCWANTRAIYASTVEHLAQSGIHLPYIWDDDIWSGAQAGAFFRTQKAQGKLPPNARVIDGIKSNPDPEKLEKMLLATGHEFFIMSYTHGKDGHVHMAQRVTINGREQIIILDPSWTGATLTDDMGTQGGYHNFQDYINSFVNGKKIMENGKMVHGKAPNRYTISSILCLSSSNENHSVSESHSPKQEIETKRETLATVHSIDIFDDELEGKIDALIHKRAPSSPITGSMVIATAKAHHVPPEYLLAMMINDSTLGTQWKWKRTKNPGNVGNDDAGNEVVYDTWEEWVNAVGKNLAMRIRAFRACYPDTLPLLSYLVTNTGPDGKWFMKSQDNYKKPNPKHNWCYMTKESGQKMVVNLALSLRKSLGLERAVFGPQEEKIASL